MKKRAVLLWSLVLGAVGLVTGAAHLPAYGLFMAWDAPGFDDAIASGSCLPEEGEVEPMDEGDVESIGETSISCTKNGQCGSGFYCKKTPGNCAGVGQCSARPQACTDVYDPVCGCNGITYPNRCYAAVAGVNLAGEDICN